MRFQFNGIVAADDDIPVYRWFGMTAIGPAMIRNALAEAEADGELTLEVNSPGGSAIAGMEIYNILADARIPVRAVVQSYAASAASYAILACRQVQMAPGSQMMLHRPATQTAGNAADHEQSIQMLGSMFSSMLDVYCRRCGEKASRQELEALCYSETWLTAQRCVELGLADELYSPPVADPRNMAAAFWLPDVATLRARYEARNTDPADGAAPPEQADWQTNALLAMETEKYKFLF